jgi:hypothetical protein
MPNNCMPMNCMPVNCMPVNCMPMNCIPNNCIPNNCVSSDPEFHFAPTQDNCNSHYKKYNNHNNHNNQVCTTYRVDYEIKCKKPNRMVYEHEYYEPCVHIKTKRQVCTRCINPNNCECGEKNNNVYY